LRAIWIVREDTLSGDVLATARSSPLAAKNCLFDILGNLNEFQSEFNLISSLARLSTSMIDSGDERALLDELLDNAPFFLRSLERLRQGVNQATGHCSQDGAVAVKAQEVLNLYRDAASMVGSIIKKIGARSPR
jgi:hypothetical protein